MVDLDLISILITPVTVLFAMMMGFMLLRQFLRIREGGRFEVGPVKLQSLGNPTSSDNGEFLSEPAFPGFVFVNVPENHKSLFIDALRGFEEFSKLKGYEVSVSTETSIQDKVGFKIIVKDIGVTVSSERVKTDVDEFIQKVNNGGGLDSMPIVVDPIEHGKLVSTLKGRFSLLEHELNLKSMSVETYKTALANARDYPQAGIGYQQPTPVQNHISVITEGGKSMGDTRTANNSPGAAIGDNSSTNIENSSIAIGSTVSEKNTQIGEIIEILELIRGSTLSDNDKNDACRYFDNIKEEVDAEDVPDKWRIEKWMDKAKGILSSVEKGSELYDKAVKVFGSFNYIF